METSLKEKQFLFPVYEEEGLERMVEQLMASSYIKRITNCDKHEEYLSNPLVKERFRNKKLGSFLAKQPAILLPIAYLLYFTDSVYLLNGVELFDEQTGVKVQQELLQTTVYKKRLDYYQIWHRNLTPWPVANIGKEFYLVGDSNGLDELPIVTLFLTPIAHLTNKNDGWDLSRIDAIYDVSDPYQKMGEFHVDLCRYFGLSESE